MTSSSTICASRRVFVRAPFVATATRCGSFSRSLRTVHAGRSADCGSRISVSSRYSDFCGTWSRSGITASQPATSGSPHFAPSSSTSVGAAQRPFISVSKSPPFPPSARHCPRHGSSRASRFRSCSRACPPAVGSRFATGFCWCSSTTPVPASRRSRTCASSTSRSSDRPPFDCTARAASGGRVRSGRRPPSSSPCSSDDVHRIPTAPCSYPVQDVR